MLKKLCNDGHYNILGSFDIEKYTFIWDYSAFKINVSECKINNVNNAFLKSMLIIQIFAEAYKFF